MALAVAGLAAHELSTERVVHSLATEDTTADGVRTPRYTGS